jgi:addiction module RelE/StbE family toxin
MKWALETTPSFLRAAKRLLRRHPAFDSHLAEILQLLETDAFAPVLRTHKLKGRLAGCWAASAGYDLRIIFEILPTDTGEKITLHSIGTHDEVY